MPERAISLYAPWVYAILRLGKDIENRHAGFEKGTGWFWLHASMFGKAPGAMFEETEAMIGMARRAGAMLGDEITVHQMQSLRGAILGIVEITGHARESTSPWFVGPLGLTLGGRHALRERVEAKGALGLWEPRAEVITELRDQVGGRVGGSK